ncbi:2'-5' RNA ligase family protein [Chitinophaga alhagiae]|nr:2'-5' RNA ligase family protein [Chitinophaga alhagiae]
MFEEDRAVVRYAILISPPAAVKKAVAGFKQQLHEAVGLDDMNLKSLAHISLCRVNAADDDAFVITTATRAVANMCCFDIEINGADSFTHGKTGTLYLRIERPEPVQILFVLLNRVFRASRNANITPHLTIARALPAGKFRQIDPAAFAYRYAFVCDRITILKWAGERYNLIHEVPLQNRPPA